MAAGILLSIPVVTEYYFNILAQISKGNPGISSISFHRKKQIMLKAVCSDKAVNICYCYESAGGALPINITD